MTLQTTALIHETYLKLIGGAHLDWTHRGHFFTAAANAMRQILIDDARRRRRLKRGGGGVPDSSQEQAGPDPSVGEEQSARVAGSGDEPAVFDQDPAEMLALDEALNKLEKLDKRQAKVVLLRFFGGLTGDETAEALGVSPRTVDNDWPIARAWLRRELGG